VERVPTHPAKSVFICASPWPISSSLETNVRQVLLRIPIRGDWSLGPLGDVPGFGFGIVLLAWCLFGAFSLRRLLKSEGGFTSELKVAAGYWTAFAVGIVLIPSIVPPQITHLPVFGYGAMLVAGVLACGWTAARRAPLASADPTFAREIAVWIVLSGVVGARLFHLVQYRERVFAGCESVADYVKASVNLPDGGLVLYGGIILATITYFVMCRMNKVDPLKFGDAMIPAVFVGIAFGRLGCFLNGCCYGNACSLPWAVQFPKDSVPWNALVQRGFLMPDALQTMSLHPTQIYSSINGVVLAAIMIAYYRYRKGDGSVIALAMMLYPISRISLEILRNDELGQLGTGLTISQLVSLGVLLAGMLLSWWSWTRPSSQLSSTTSPGGQVSPTV
jgi:phosphatidylglycerol---prolipoprotein diacylglyceryl transferase